VSYLVDALKKAERERHVNQRADLRSLAEGEPPPHGLTSGRALRWLVGLLVACNAALLVYLFVPTPVSGAFVAPASEVVAADQAGQEPSAEETQSANRTPPLQTVEAPSASADGEAAPRQSQPAAGTDTRPTRAGEREQRAPVARARPSRDTLPPTMRAPDDRRSLRLSDGAGSSRGRVTYSQTPLDATPAWQNDDRAARRRTRDRRDSTSAAAPDVAINGHLYSTVPGRSFILVDGRRYHEGERLAAGPAVESIDAAGATLNYRGDRFHVDGPS